MKTHRIQRVEREIQQLLSQYILRYMRAELPTLVSVSRVLCGKDLRQAKVFLSIMGDDVIRKECLDMFADQQSEIQRYLGKELSTRYTPKLQMEIDTGIDHYLKVESILHSISNNEKQI